MINLNCLTKSSTMFWEFQKIIGNKFHYSKHKTSLFNTNDILQNENYK